MFRPQRQRGAALFIALMVLIVLSVLGVAASRVTALQERMAGIYLADNRAFMAAEDRLNDQERTVLASDPDQICTTPVLADPIASGWLDGTTTTASQVVENLTNPSSSFVRAFGVGDSKQLPAMTPGGAGCLLFRVSSLDFDSAGQSSRAVVQSTFIP